MKKRILYIVNPHSGTGKKHSLTSLIKEKTDSNIYDYAIANTAYAGHATHLAEMAKHKGYDVVVAVGGDGTVNEVGRALVKSKTALGIIPCGSGNGLARHLRLPLNPALAIDIINACEIHTLDYGTINDRPFFCTCGVGFDAFISEKFAASTRRGLLTYMENTLRSGLRYRPQTYRIEDETGEISCKAFLIACANASQYGNNAFIAPYASMKDGMFDVVVMEPFNAIEAPQVAIQLFNGTLPANSHVKTFRASHLYIRREDKGVAHYDGDPFVTDAVIEVQLHSRNFRVVVNPWKENDSTIPNIGQNILQRVPEFFNDWKRMPETIINKTGHDLKHLNRQVLERFKVLSERIIDKDNRQD